MKMRSQSQKLLTGFVERPRKRTELVVVIYGVFSLMITQSRSLDSNDDLIVGGVIAYIEEFPFLVSFQSNLQHRCGGSLVSTTKVLTACHCLADHIKNRLFEIGMIPLEGKSVLAGISNLKNFKSGERRNATLFTIHPNCAAPFTGWTYDIAMITVASEFPVKSGNIQLLPLPDFNKISLDKMSDSKSECTTAGWGVTGEKNDFASDHLMKVNLQLRSSETCSTLVYFSARKRQSAFRFIKESQVCAIGETGKDACRGDSGGPLMCDDGSGNRVISGVTSWGFGCGKSGSPGMWARMDVAIPWIKDQLDPNGDHKAPNLKEKTETNGGANEENKALENTDGSEAGKNATGKVSACHIMTLPCIIILFFRIKGIYLSD